ncbi:MAG TPA: threonine/serine exporter family protein, partial [Candidatus Limnocylindrales bacterium]
MNESASPHPPPEAGTMVPRSEGPPDTGRVLRLTLRVAVNMLASGAQTDDVEASIGSVARGLGIGAVQAAVTFSTISVSYDAGPGVPPMTLLHIVHERTLDFDRLAAMATIVSRVQAGELDLAGAEQELDRVESGRPTYRQAAAWLAPALSAAGTTLVFGGNLEEAAVTLGIALVVQPALTALNRSQLPPFFRLVFGATASTLLVVVLAALGAPIGGGLVLTGSLLRFLPGYALVSGFRDLIGESIISGTARLAEALLLGSGVAAGTAFGLRVGEAFDVHLALVLAGHQGWDPLVLFLAALLAVGGYAVSLGVPRRSVGQAALLGAAAWVILRTVTVPQGPLDPALATLLSAIAVGAVGRLLSRHYDAPSALWVVPAILPLLPGLQLIQALLAQTDIARVSGLIAATATAFLIGTGVATGDIVVATIRRIRERIVSPTVDAVSGGIEVLVVAPVGRAVNAARGERTEGGQRHRP